MSDRKRVFIKNPIRGFIDFTVENTVTSPNIKETPYINIVIYLTTENVYTMGNVFIWPCFKMYPCLP